MQQQSLFGMLVASEPEASTQDFLGLPLEEATFTVIDCETTGLSAKKNALTEIAAIHYVNGVEQSKYVTLVKPPEAIPEMVEDLTGITNDMVKNAPAPITALTELCNFVGSSPLIVGHNVGFDIRFITEKLHECGLSSFANRFDIERAFCTKMLATKVFPGLPSYEGIVVATRCGIVNPNPHRAENDVRMSADILFALFELIRQSDPTVTTPKKLLTYQGPLQREQQ